MAAVEQLLATLDLDPDVVTYLVDCLSALGAQPSADDVAEVLAPFADELELSDADALALAEVVVVTLGAPRPAEGGDGASEPAPAPAPADKPAVDPLAAGGDLPYGGDWNAAMAAQDRAAVRLILEHREATADQARISEHRDRVATEAAATQAREERAAQLAQQQQEQEQQEQQHHEQQERRIDPSDGNAYTQQDFIDAYGGTAQWDAIGAQPQGYRKPDLADEFPTMGKAKKKKNKQRASQPEPEPEPTGLSGNAKAFSMSAAAAAPVFHFGGPPPEPENAWGPALGQPAQQSQQWGRGAVPGPPDGPPPGQPPNRHDWQAQPQQQQQHWPPQQQQQASGVAPAQLDFATKMKLKNLQEQYGWVGKDQVAHAYITTGAHMGKTEQYLQQTFPKPADWVQAPPPAGAPGGPALPGMSIARAHVAPTLSTAKPVGDYFAIGLQHPVRHILWTHFHSFRSF